MGKKKPGGAGNLIVETRTTRSNTTYIYIYIYIHIYVLYIYIIYMYSLYIYIYVLSLYIYICTLYIYICIHVYEVPLICGHWQTSLFVTLILLACISQVSIFLGMFRCKPQIWPTCFQGIEISIIASKWQIHHCLSIEVLLPVADCMEWTSSSSTASWKLNWGYFVPKGIGILLLRTSSDFKKKKT